MPEIKRFSPKPMMDAAFYQYLSIRHFTPFDVEGTRTILFDLMNRIENKKTTLDDVDENVYNAYLKFKAYINFNQEIELYD